MSRCLGKTFSPGDVVILSELDHEINIAPWLQMAEERNLVVHWSRVVQETCTLDLDQLQSLIGRRARLITVSMASNSSGSVNPVSQIACRLGPCRGSLGVDQTGGVLRIGFVHYYNKEDEVDTVLQALASARPAKMAFPCPRLYESHCAQPVAW